MCRKLKGYSTADVILHHANRAKHFCISDPFKRLQIAEGPSKLLPISGVVSNSNNHVIKSKQSPYLVLFTFISLLRRDYSANACPRESRCV